MRNATRRRGYGLGRTQLVALAAIALAVEHRPFVRRRLATGRLARRPQLPAHPLQFRGVRRQVVTDTASLATPSYEPVRQGVYQLTDGPRPPTGYAQRPHYLGSGHQLRGREHQLTYAVSRGRIRPHRIERGDREDGIGRDRTPYSIMAGD